METIGNIVVGKPEVKPDTPSHTAGVREGNKRKVVIPEPGTHHVHPLKAQASARRSTGINAKGRQPIDPRMPLLFPA
jgi:hypothetical protein